MSIGMAEPLDNPAVELRPGVFRPDWSVVTSPAAGKLLRSRTASRPSLVEKWTRSLRPVEDAIWRRLLKLFVRLGRPPSVRELAAQAGIPLPGVRPLLRELQDRDLVEFDETGETIIHAYPLTGRQTGHTVQMGERVLNALCAIDALGTGAMFDRDLTVRSECRLCGTPIKITTGERGRKLRNVSPAGVVVWYDLSYVGSAATSCCPKTVFFCSDEHLDRWREPEGPGMRLSADEALEIGRAIFGPILVERTRGE